MRYPGSLKALIYIFHMPLFFFLSGYVHNNGVSMGGFALKKAKSLLYPYYVIGTIYILHNTLLDVLMRKFEWGYGNEWPHSSMAIIYGITMPLILERCGFWRHCFVLKAYSSCCVDTRLNLLNSIEPCFS